MQDHKPIPGSIKERNMKYLGLRFQEESWHEHLMKTSMQYWPESLSDFVTARRQSVGICGDVISVAVADWIRLPRVCEQAAECRQRETP